MNMNQNVNGVKLVKQCSIKPSAESTESKTIELAVKFDGVTLGDVFAKALSSAVIQWQNGPGRKLFDTWKNGQTVTIEFKAPGRAPQVPVEIAYANKLASMTKSERLAELKRLAEQAESMDDDNNE